MRDQIKILTFSEVSATESYGRGWIKAKCLKESCNTITVWRTSTGVKCAEGKCGKCEGPVKRTVWSTTTDYIVKG